jgi:hypothetical protein
VLPLYARTGRSFARGLIPPAEVETYRGLGIAVDEAESLCWTFQRSQFRPFTEHMRRLFAMLKTMRVARGVKISDAA